MRNKVTDTKSDTPRRDALIESLKHQESCDYVAGYYELTGQLERENDALRKDAERLDFLESKARVNFNYEICSIEFGHNAQEEGYNTIREVIDAAIKEQSNG